jgi:hypothetical protein
MSDCDSTMPKCREKAADAVAQVAF